MLNWGRNLREIAEDAGKILSILNLETGERFTLGKLGVTALKAIKSRDLVGLCLG